MSENTTTQTDADTETTPEDQTTLLTFQTTTTVDDDGDTHDAVHVDVKTADDDTDHSAEIEQYEALPEKSPLHEKAMSACESLGVDTRVVEFTKVPTVQTDDNGDAYIEDARGLVRFYLGDETPEDRLLTTQDYVESARVAEEFTQRKNDLEQMLGTA